ncbi:hypothetical protein MPLB_2410074 [Mesorhizobium sp. ORS 3324]|nr:hypothetical protein MPLB_2410074 [Mesorhizobium sp. ORS 3324]
MADADLSGKVDDGVDVRYGLCDRVSIAHISPYQLGASRDADRYATVNLLQERVQDTDFVAMFGEFVGDVPADETAASRNQYTFHESSLPI